MEYQNNKKIGVALSGGVYRAAAYHIGTLKALNRLALLDNVDVISSVSGGSITSAFYALHKDDYDNFEFSLIKRLQKGVLWSSYVNLILVVILMLISGLVVGWWFLVIDIIILLCFWYKILPLSFWQ